MDYYHISAQDLGKDAKIPVVKLGDSGEVFYEIAMEMINTIKAHNEKGEKTVFICPVGPVGQYPIFVRLVNRDRISLKNCWFINMDEYLNDDDTYIDKDSPLSFRGFMERTVYTKVDPELLMPPEQRVFPDPAPAMTKDGPSSYLTARSCSSFSSLSIFSKKSFAITLPFFLKYTIPHHNRKYAVLHTAPHITYHIIKVGPQHRIEQPHGMAPHAPIQDRQNLLPPPQMIAQGGIKERCQHHPGRHVLKDAGNERGRIDIPRHAT